MRSEYTQRICKSAHCGCKVGHTREYNYEFDTYEWKCYNCGLLTPIRKKATPVTQANGLTAGQQKTIDTIREGLLRKHYGDAHAASYEFKAFEVDPKECWAWVTIETGKIGDEGTYGALLGRRRMNLQIGPRGGILKVHGYAKESGPSEHGLWHDVYYGWMGR